MCLGGFGFDLSAMLWILDLFLCGLIRLPGRGFGFVWGFGFGFGLRLARVWVCWFCVIW